MSPLRVLQAVGTLDRGGVETWLLHVLRRVDRRDIEIDFLVHGSSSGALTQEAVALGAQVLRIGGHRRPGYGRRLEGLLSEGRYDILHSHLHFFSGRILRAAAGAGVPVRIAHSHNALPSLASSKGLRRAYTRLMGGVIDVLVLPSLHEGLGLVLMEAQAAGIPSVIAHTISEEADVVPDAIVRLSLEETPQHWVQTALCAVREVPFENALEQMKGSPFNVDNSAAALRALYRRAAESHRPVSRL